MAAINNKALLQAAQDGSVDAFRRLVFDYDADILALLMRITESPCEARRLYLQVMLRMLGQLRGFHFECAFYIWVFRCCSTVVLDYLSRRRAMRSARGDRALDALTPRERVVLELKHYRRESLETISQMLGISKEAAGSALVGGIQKLSIGIDEHCPANS